ncbi:MFS transporter [Ideonella sp.]
MNLANNPAAAASATPPANLRWVLGSLALGMLLPSLGTSIASVALPTLAEAFHASFQQLQWVVLAYLLASTTLIVSVGRLGDLVGRRRLLLAGIALFTIASGACGMADRLWLLIAARAAQGLGAAVMLTLTMALVGEAVPKARTGSAMGLLGTMSAVGTALGPSLGGVLIAHFGWQAIFWVNLPLGVLALCLVWRHLPADRAAKQPAMARPGFDHAGTVLLALTLAAYAMAMTWGRGHLGTLNLMLLAAAGLGGALFIAAERRAASPLIRLARFREPALRASLAMSALVATVIMTTFVVGPFYLAHALHLSTAQVGLALAVGPVISSLTGLPAGRSVDRFGAARVTRFGLGAMMAGCLALCLAPSAFGIAGYLVPLALLTVGYALFQAANNTAVMADVAADQRGVISGLLNLSRNLGLITGASLMGAVFAWGVGATDFGMAKPGAVAHGMRVTFAVAAGLLVLGLALSRKRRSHGC